MGKRTMESWLGRVGLTLPRKSMSSGVGAAVPEKARIGVLSFEVASLMSKVVRLWQSLADDQIARIRDDVLLQDGVRKLVSDDDSFVLGLALAEIFDCFCFLARSTARLGRKCSDPVLQRLEHALTDLISSGADPFGLEYMGKKMERKVKKMERFVAASVNLYQEMEVLAELETGLRRMQASAASDTGGLIGFRQKVAWQRQEVRCLREASLWNRTYDYTVRLLARSLFTIIGRIKQVFAFHHTPAASAEIEKGMRVRKRLHRSHSLAGGATYSSVFPSHANDGGMVSSARLGMSGPLVMPSAKSEYIAVPKSGPIPSSNIAMSGGQCLPHRSTRLRSSKSFGSITKWPVPGGPFSGCIAAGEDSPVLQSCVPSDSVSRRSNAMTGVISASRMIEPETQFVGTIFSKDLIQSLFEHRHKLLVAPPSTLGAAALALHYANVIVVIEKLAASPHLIGPDARDDLYNMLPASIRSELRAKLKSYAKNLAVSVYDPVLASEWSDAMTRILEWLAPLAHNMIKWQSERNYEQQHLFSKTNVLLLQTLYFANQAKTEAAITELLVGLNYLWRFGKELNAKAMLESISSRSFDNCLDLRG